VNVTAFDTKGDPFLKVTLTSALVAFITTWSPGDKFTDEGFATQLPRHPQWISIKDEFCFAGTVERFCVFFLAVFFLAVFFVGI